MSVIALRTELGLARKRSTSRATMGPRITGGEGSDAEDLLFLRREFLVGQDPLFVQLRELL
jgi:hypothetical protein